VSQNRDKQPQYSLDEEKGKAGETQPMESF
jgi:hypothetical protein